MQPNLTSLRQRDLPVSRGATAAGASTAESAKASTTASATETASTTAAESSAEEHPEEETDSAGGGEAGEQKEDDEQHRAADKQLSEADLPDLVRRRAATGRGLEIDSGVGGDDLRDLDDGGGDGGIVVPCLQLRDD